MILDLRVRQPSRSTFRDNLCLLSYFNAGSFIQQDSCVVRKKGPLAVKDVQTVFELSLWLHCLNCVGTEVEQKRMCVKMTYRTGNIVDRNVKRVVTAWTALLRRFGTEALSTYIIMYMLINTAICILINLMAQGVFALLMRGKTLFHRCDRSVPVVQVTIKLLWDATHNTPNLAMRHLEYAFF